MLRTRKLAAVLMAVYGFFGTGLQNAFAHETRIVGPYKFVIGFTKEPSFVDESNAIDVIVSRASDGRPIDRTAGDIVDLEVEVQLRDAEAFDSEIVDSAPLEDPLTQAFQSPNKYNSWFKPTIEGPYAFHITGLVSDESDPKAGPLEIDQTFVCGKGTLAENGHGFHCVAVPQAFPSSNGKAK